MSSERCAVGKHRHAANQAIVRHVRVGHEQIVTANPGNTFVVRGAPIDGAALTEYVAIADLQPRRLPRVFLVLRGIADGGELKDAVVRPNDSWPVDDSVGTYHGARPDLHIRTNDRERPDRHVGGELCSWRYDRPRVNHLPVSGATIISACATSVSPTTAMVSNFQIPLSARCTVALRIN